MFIMVKAPVKAPVPVVFAARMGTRARAYGSNSGIIMPGQPDRNQGTPGRIILPGHGKSPPKMPPGQGNFPELAQDVAGRQDVPAPPRNFRPPSGFMDKQGPEQDIYAAKTPEEVLMIISTRSDYWYNLAKGLPKLYAAGFDRNTLEEKINVDAARQNIWSVSAEVFRSLQACPPNQLPTSTSHFIINQEACTPATYHENRATEDKQAHALHTLCACALATYISKAVTVMQDDLSDEQCQFFQNEDHSPDCLMELRFLDRSRRIEGARYIADHRLSPDDSLVLARAIKEHARRTEAAAGFSGAAGDCLAFKYYRDAEETRDVEDRLRHISVMLLLVELALLR